MVALHKTSGADRGPGSPLPQLTGQPCGIAATTFDSSDEEFTDRQHHGQKG
jgi:hypothetical protein